MSYASVKGKYWTSIIKYISEISLKTLLCASNMHIHRKLLGQLLLLSSKLGSSGFKDLIF